MQCLFVGAGSIAAEYAAELANSPLSLAGICDLEEERAQSLAEAHDCPAFVDIDTALATVDAPIVLNLTSHAAHGPVTRTALEAGRHVYSQKPLALSESAAADLLALAQAQNLALGCAPGTPRGPSQRRAGRLIADGRLGPVQLGYAHAHVGRVTNWHDRPESFLSIGPLYDGGVYQLALLVSWFGPVTSVRAATTLDSWPDREPKQPSVPSHIEATLAFDDTLTVRLTASFYVPHRSREFYGLELHGDDGSLYLRGTGAMTDSPDAVRYGRVGRNYIDVPAQRPTRPYRYLDPVESFAAGVAQETPSRETGRRGTHIVAICNAIEAAAETGGPVTVSDYGAAPDPIPAPTVAPSAERDTDQTAAVRLPAIGFGCSRYRNGAYIERGESIAAALDAGYRLLDSAELYGNEHRIGRLLAAPGAPDRERLFVLGKVWRTNHRRDHLLRACRGSLDELGIDTFDCYALHWPEAWAHRGPLDRLAEKSVERQEALTFPEDDAGNIETADISLQQAWLNLEAVHDRGWARTLGLCNVSQTQLETVLESGTVTPALVQIERHPYQPRTDLVKFCHEQGIRVVAHSPLSAPGLLDDPVLTEVADEYDCSPAGAVLAWNVTQGVVPIPSSTTPDHIIENLAAAGQRLDTEACARIDGLQQPDFDR